jgi:hypothetical protein
MITTQAETINADLGVHQGLKAEQSPKQCLSPTPRFRRAPDRAGAGSFQTSTIGGIL